MILHLTTHTSPRKLSSCPYCGNDDMTLDVCVILTCKVNHEGTFSLNDWWTKEQIQKEAIAEVTDNDLRGFCNNCGNYSIAKRTRDGLRVCFFKEERK